MNKTQNVVIRVQAQTLPAVVAPTVDELAQPMMDGKQLALPKTWVSEKQIMRMVQRTPSEHVYTRLAKGGGTWSYVTGAYVEKVLNFVFGFMWDFEIIEHGIEGGQVWVKGKLTVKDPAGHEITKMQFGRADIKMKKTGGMLDFGNDLKGASTDALKKCASLLGIASDIYGKTEYKQETGNDARDVPPPQPQDGGKTAPDVRIVPDTTQTPTNVELYCHGANKGGCEWGREITQSEHDFSLKMYGRPLCRDCQKLSKPIKK